MSNSSDCRAKNRAECRVHGAGRFAPLPSNKAQQLLEKAEKAIRNVTDYDKYSELRQEVVEAKANFHITKKGIQALREKKEATRKEFETALVAGHDNADDLATIAYESEFEYATAKNIRQTVLENYAEALIDTEFDSDSDRDVAHLAAFHNFAVLEMEGRLDADLGNINYTREQFFEKLKDKEFTEKLAKVERMFTGNAHETLDERNLDSHPNIRRSFVRDNCVMHPTFLTKAILEGQKSFLT